MPLATMIGPTSPPGSWGQMEDSNDRLRGMHQVAECVEPTGGRDGARRRPLGCVGLHPLARVGWLIVDPGLTWRAVGVDVWLEASPIGFALDDEIVGRRWQSDPQRSGQSMSSNMGSQSLVSRVLETRVEALALRSTKSW